MIEISNFANEINAAVYKSSFLGGMFIIILPVILACTFNLLKWISKRKDNESKVNYRKVITSIVILGVLYPSSYFLATNSVGEFNEYRDLVVAKEKAIKDNLSMLLEEKEEDFMNGQFSLNELTLEIESHPEFFGTLKKYNKVWLNGEALNKKLELLVYKQYDRNNPLYKELIDTSVNYKNNLVSN